ncbi:light induced alcohol dehydrogenase Bli-4 [Fusarium acutatum]|uniref:Light induced alcohol dehydrogenase Bli-4 n=1 Tax=Fusarium acutatum TaxID=78861 RepID=A0A8H4JJB1_9HYPO|nr:light induced alcohol dehydrogenase Bli-4 [Fusarium acutatum]
MSLESQQSHSKTPVLKLRPSVTTEQIVPRQKIKQPYGPWIAHPDLIDEELERRRHLVHFPPDVTRDEHRQRWKDEIPVLEAEIEDCKLEDFDLRAVISMDKNWDDADEEDRRVRARTMVKHILQNEKWAKSEYAWEADAWKDVFGVMRDDPVLAVDKHAYNTIREKRHPVTCLLTGESKFIKRIPDATFGLATFKPRDYQSPIAEWDLDRDRLEALSLHRYCGLHSDPSWGKSSLVFPFAAYEAKGWSGDPREARRQACSAGSVYLDMLDRLSKVPGKPGDLDGAYQAQDSRNSQVFVFTSFGAHWHILVGYRRPRLAREHAGMSGMSKTVYDFQRIWSGRVSTERRAWELLSLIDQIHLWGVTVFRDFVIRHLKPWHEFAKRCYVNDIDFTTASSDKRIRIFDESVRYWFPRPCNELAEWTRHFPPETQLRFRDALGHFLFQANASYCPETRGKSDSFTSLFNCIIGTCSKTHLVGYPLGSLEEVHAHLYDFHGVEPGTAPDLFLSAKELLSRKLRVWEVGQRLFLADRLVLHDDEMEVWGGPSGKRKLKDIMDEEREAQGFAMRDYGKVALVTGANTPDGVGYHIEHQLALKGAKVYIGARNLQKATKAIRLMLAESPQLKHESLVPFAVDMGNFKQVQFAARKVVAEEPRLDILVNNAAVLARPLDKDSNGISVSFGINHLGPFLLTRELLPLLNKTQAEHPGVRIVNVASTAHYDVPTGAKFGSLEDFNTTYGSEDDPFANYLRYGYSKLASILHTKELQRRFDQEGVDILALSVHPGGVATNGAAGYLGGRDNDTFRSNLSPFEGAITPLFAAAHPEPAQQRDKYAGSFIMPFGGLKEPTEDANNVELAKQLWTTSEKVVSSVLDCFIWDSILMPMGGIFNIGQKA